MWQLSCCYRDPIIIQGLFLTLQSGVSITAWQATLLYVVFQEPSSFQFVSSSSPSTLSSSACSKLTCGKERKEPRESTPTVWRPQPRRYTDVFSDPTEENWITWPTLTTRNPGKWDEARQPCAWLQFYHYGNGGKSTFMQLRLRYSPFSLRPPSSVIWTNDLISLLLL